MLTQARRRLAAERATVRLGGRLAALVAAARRDVLAAVPAAPHPLHAYPHADRAAAVTLRLSTLLAGELRRGLSAVGSWSHLRAARLLTRCARGTAPLTRVRREDWIDDLLPAGDDYRRLLTDPPSADLLRLIVGPAPDRLTRLIDPEAASRAVFDGVSRGRDRRQIAAELGRLFGGWESAARRVARTEGLRVATETQLAASEEIPGLVIGYQILAVLDSRTRPDHRKRSGTVYYRNPRPGQIGLSQMPRPPLEPDGRVSFNCRCLLSPVFASDTPEDLSAAAAVVA